jgi:acylpyruvate hydrolase
MRLASLKVDGQAVLALRTADGYRNLSAADASLGTDVGALLASGDGWQSRVADAADQAPLITGAVEHRPVIPRPGKVMCLGLNDAAHAKEAGLAIPKHPVVFMRVASSLIGHGQPMLRPAESEMLDYEVELAVIIGKGGRRISQADALDHIAGYSVFNDGSVRDWQVRSPQWSLGKNFHGTGALGPELVTPDELPEGGDGLRKTTVVSGETLQDGTTATWIFRVAETIEELSKAMLLEPGDVIAMGTPAGVGHARRPQRWLRPGETCTVSIEGVGSLTNPIVSDPSTPE